MNALPGTPTTGIDALLGNIPEITKAPSLVGPVLMNWGVNDVGFSITESQWTGDYETIITWLHGKYPYATFWIAYPWRADCCNTETAQLHTWIDNDILTWCAAQGYVCHQGPDEAAVLSFSGAFDAGGVHYSATGAAAMAAAWKTALGW